MRRSTFSPSLARAFEIVFAPWQRLHLAGIHVRASWRATLPEDRPLLLVANHVSWWDGFILRAVQRRVRRDAVLLIVVDERVLERHAFFRRLGAVGVERGSPRSVRALLRTIQDWRARHGARLVVVLFPQGRIWPSSRRPLGFARGVEAIVRVLGPVAIVPVAIHVEPLTSISPHAFASIGEPIVHEARESIPAVAEIERRVECELERLRCFLEREGENAAVAWLRNAPILMRGAPRLVDLRSEP